MLVQTTPRGEHEELLLSPTACQQKCLYGKGISADNLGCNFFIVLLLCHSDYAFLWVSAIRSDECFQILFRAIKSFQISMSEFADWKHECSADH